MHEKEFQLIDKPILANKFVCQEAKFSAPVVYTNNFSSLQNAILPRKLIAFIV